ncbi:MAG: tetratricopeptide repeat protein [Alphaproteobacteria bacterium]|nr:tetratricopeptide repeat protein [Alphaproteobacteria bacterium]
MKKAPAKNTKKIKKSNGSADKPGAKVVKTKSCVNPWSLSIYVYWFIILFFIAATFYILGRSHNAVNITNNDAVTEEALMQASDYYENGKTKLLAGNIDEAVADLTTAIDSGSASVDTYILRGEAYMQSGDYRNAMADFDAALEKDSQNAVAFYDRALLNTRLEDYSAALNDINN